MGGKRPVGPAPTCTGWEQEAHPHPALLGLRPPGDAQPRAAGWALPCPAVLRLGLGAWVLLWALSGGCEPWGLGGCNWGLRGGLWRLFKGLLGGAALVLGGGCMEVRGCMGVRGCIGTGAA